MVTTVPNRTYSVNHMASRQVITGGEPGFSRRAATEFTAFFEQLRSGRSMDGPVHAAAAQKALVGSIDNCIDFQSGNVSLDDFYLVFQ